MKKQVVVPKTAYEDMGTLRPCEAVNGIPVKELIEHLENRYFLSGGKLGRHVRRLSNDDTSMTLFFPHKLGLSGNGWPLRHWGFCKADPNRMLLKPGVDNSSPHLPAYKCFYQSFNLYFRSDYFTFQENKTFLCIYLDGELFEVIGTEHGTDFWLLLIPCYKIPRTTDPEKSYTRSDIQ